MLHRVVDGLSKGREPALCIGRHHAELVGNGQGRRAMILHLHFGQFKKGLRFVPVLKCPADSPAVLLRNGYLVEKVAVHSGLFDLECSLAHRGANERKTLLSVK